MILLQGHLITASNLPKGIYVIVYIVVSYKPGYNKKAFPGKGKARVYVLTDRFLFRNNLKFNINLHILVKLDGGGIGTHLLNKILLK